MELSTLAVFLKHFTNLMIFFLPPMILMVEYFLNEWNEIVCSCEAEC